MFGFKVIVIRTNYESSVGTAAAQSARPRPTYREIAPLRKDGAEISVAFRWNESSATFAERKATM
jgi:hypothetical protein